ncbi:hypothetical protein Trydic_g7064 [Trypoxylus dichotomus]
MVTLSEAKREGVKTKGIGNNVAFAKDSSRDITPPTGSGQRFALMQAGNRNGFIAGPEYYFLCKKNSLDVHDETCTELYKDWFLNNVLPNLAGNSVIVIDNISYHSRQIDEVSTAAIKEYEIVCWLNLEAIGFEQGLLGLQKSTQALAVGMHKSLHDWFDFEPIPIQEEVPSTYESCMHGGHDTTFGMKRANKHERNVTFIGLDSPKIGS